MKQRKMLSFTLYQLGLFFRQELPGLVAQADASRDAGEFRARLEEFVARHAAAQGEAAEQIRLLIGYDGREVSELSTGEQMPVRTLELLWQFLTGRLENPEMRCDSCCLTSPPPRWTRRWYTRCWTLSSSLPGRA